MLRFGARFLSHNRLCRVLTAVAIFCNGCHGEASDITCCHGCRHGTQPPPPPRLDNTRVALTTLPHATCSELYLLDCAVAWLTALDGCDAVEFEVSTDNCSVRDTFVPFTLATHEALKHHHRSFLSCHVPKCAYVSAGSGARCETSTERVTTVWRPTSSGIAALRLSKAGDGIDVHVG